MIDQENNRGLNAPISSGKTLKVRMQRKRANLSLEFFPTKTNIYFHLTPSLFYIHDQMVNIMLMEKSTNERAVKLIFWIGTLSSLALFLALTVDTTRQFAALTHADRLDDQVVAGKRAFERHNCNDCHTILGFGGYYAPDLTRAYVRLGESAVARRRKSPDVAFADSYRKMPQQNLSEKETADITAYLRWVSNIENHDWPPQDSRNRTWASQ